MVTVTIDTDTLLFLPSTHRCYGYGQHRYRYHGYRYHKYRYPALLTLDTDTVVTVIMVTGNIDTATMVTDTIVTGTMVTDILIFLPSTHRYHG